VATINDDDHLRATEKMRKDLHETFPNADVNVREDFIAPILHEARAKLAEAGTEKPDIVTTEAEYIPAPAYADGDPHRTDDFTLRPDFDKLAALGIRPSMVTPQTFGESVIPDTEETRAVRARARVLLHMPEWRDRYMTAAGDGPAMERLYADADEKLGPYLDSYRAMVQHVQHERETTGRIFSQVPPGAA
jgi:hypothetical protein